MNSNIRASSLDALRGYAILTMVLSGSIAWGVLPGWMYHAQVGPRSNFVFDGSIYGITWVDLVFPFFLFAMGAAFPFSIGNKYRKGSSRWKIVYDSVLRGFRLTFFCYLHSTYLSLGGIFSTGYPIMADCVSRFCIDVSHVYENPVQNAGIREITD